MVMFVERAAYDRLTFLLNHFPAVGLVGPRQVGKTSLALRLREPSGKMVYLDLERPADAAKLVDPEAFFASVDPDAAVVLDEVQRADGLFPVLRGIIDRDRKPGRLLLLGSASPALLRDSGESLAGRIAYVELSGLTLAECRSALPAQEGLLQRRWLRGGFPESFLAADDELSALWRENFITTYVERELPQLGITASPQVTRQVWRMVAHLSGQLLNVETLARSLGLDRRSVRRYLDFLEASYLIRRVRPYHANLGKRLVKSPKLYVRDTGLLHALLGIESSLDLLGRPERGGSFEALVVEEVAAHLPRGCELSFYRTSNGAELDIVIVRFGAPYLAFEVKASAAPRPSRGFYTSCEDLGIERRYLVGTVEQPYPTRHGIQVIGVADVAGVLQDVA